MTRITTERDGEETQRFDERPNVFPFSEHDWLWEIFPCQRLVSSL
jgi:hypothetical protein